MSTENESPTTESLHPDWCDFEGECTDDIVSHAVHYGRRTVWIPVADGQRVGIVLRHGEDRVKGDPVDHGTRVIELSISRGGDDVGEDVMLTADDARFLASQLVAYARTLDRDPRWYSREHLGMSAVEFAVDQGILEQHADGTVSLSKPLAPHRPDEEAPGYCVCGTLTSICDLERACDSGVREGAGDSGVREGAAIVAGVPGDRLRPSHSGRTGQRRRLRRRRQRHGQGTPHAFGAGPPDRHRQDDAAGAAEGPGRSLASQRP